MSDTQYAQKKHDFTFGTKRTRASTHSRTPAAENFHFGGNNNDDSGGMYATLRRLAGDKGATNGVCRHEYDIKHYCMHSFTRAPAHLNTHTHTMYLHYAGARAPAERCVIHPPTDDVHSTHGAGGGEEPAMTDDGDSSDWSSTPPSTTYGAAHRTSHTC